jgi:hypothetical protein
MKRKIIFLGLILSAFSIQILAQNKPKIFRGSIADKTVQMNLTRDGNKITGEYFYQKVGKNLKLSGSIDASGNFRIAEFAPAGAKTGEFRGVWKESENDSGATLEGEWTNAKTKQKWAFYATEQTIEFSGDAKLMTKTFSETNKPKMFEITAEYPELTGANPSAAAKFNAIVKDKVMKTVDSFRKNMSEMTIEDLQFAKERGVSNYLELNYVIELATDEIISIGFANSVYSGGAHPNHFSFSVNFDLKNGREIKLEELFKSGSDYLKKISEYCIEKLKNEVGDMSGDEWLENGAGARAENFESWNVKRKGILINFDPYQVAAYAAGPQEVFIPFAELKTVLKNGSPISKFK